MGVREDTLEKVLEGNTPGDVSRIMGVNPNTTLSYIFQLIGDGRLRRSDILLSVPAHRRDEPDVRQFGKANQLLGEIYEDVRFIEVTLHKLIREVLVERFGDEERGWWRQGVPENVRKNCQSKREEDDGAADDAYCYTDLLDLWKIIDNKWSIVQTALPGTLTSDKPNLKADLNKLNQIRRMVMHPVRGGAPSEEDFEFLRRFRRSLE